MHVVFLKLRYKNILSTGNDFTEIDLCKSPSTLVIGENGAGKSTMIEALIFGLFNKSYRGLTKPEIINTITRKHAEVQIDFRIGKDHYSVTRGIKPAKFEIYKNGELINQDSQNRDYQDYFEKHILKVNYKTFTQCVVLGTASYTPFMKLPAAQRREVVEDILDLQIFTHMNTILKEKSQTNEYRIVENVADKRVISEKIIFLKKQREEQSQKNLEVITLKENRIKDIGKEGVKIQKEISELESHNKVFKESLSGKEKLLEKFRELSSYKTKIEYKIYELKEHEKFFENHDVCPTCSQDITEGYKEDILYENEKKIFEYEDAEDKLQTKINKINEELDAYKKVEQQIIDNNLDISRLTSSIQGLKKNASEIMQEIKTLKNSTADVDIGEITKLEQELKENENAYNKLYQLRSDYQLVLSLLKDNGIKSRLIKQYIPVINKLINKYLSQLDFFVNFELDENFKETILSRYRDTFSYASFSEGERFRINLAILFTWRAIAKLRGAFSTNILFMDEVMDSSLDSGGTEEFLKILGTFDEGTNVFIMSHKVDQLTDKFNSIIRFVKKNNFSKVAA